MIALSGSPADGGAGWALAAAAGHSTSPRDSFVANLGGGTTVTPGSRFRAEIKYITPDVSASGYCAGPCVPLEDVARVTGATHDAYVAGFRKAMIVSAFLATCAALPAVFWNLQPISGGA